MDWGGMEGIGGLSGIGGGMKGRWGLSAMGGVLLLSLLPVPGPQSRLLGRAVAQQRLVPGAPWQGGAGGGLRFSTRLRCRPPARGPHCLPPCPPCARRCLPYPAACHVPPHRRCWPLCCAHRECPPASRCAPPPTWLRSVPTAF